MGSTHENGNGHFLYFILYNNDHHISKRQPVARFVNHFSKWPMWFMSYETTSMKTMQTYCRNTSTNMPKPINETVVETLLNLSKPFDGQKNSSWSVV
jgi:hypothetical protein